jgi:hypothetical protein
LVWGRLRAEGAAGSQVAAFAVDALHVNGHFITAVLSDGGCWEAVKSDSSLGGGLQARVA